MSRYTLALAVSLLVTCTAPAIANSEPQGPYKIAGLVQEHVLPRSHWWQGRVWKLPREWEYKLDGTDRTFRTRKKLRRVKDLRPYEVQHPVWFKVQEGCRHWGPVIDVGSKLAVPVGTAAAAAVAAD